MRIGEALQIVSEIPRPGFEKFPEKIPFAWVEEALQKSEGTAKMRSRRLPAAQVMFLVIGMAFFRDRSIAEVVSSLDLALPDPRFPYVAPSVAVNARHRLGSEPVRHLFERCSTEWAHASARANAWRGLSVYGIDGTVLRVPDSAENCEHFGKHSSGRGESAYPQVRVVTLMALRSHLLAEVRFGPISTGELTYAQELWPAIPDDSLTIEDRGFLSAGALIPYADGGENRHWLTRGKKNTSVKFIEVFEPGDGIVEMKVSSKARKANPSLPKTWRARAILYQRRGFRPQMLLTSLLDPHKYPRKEIVALYHERWELEVGYDEVKTEMLDREEAIRSRTVETVNQEIWGLLLAYNLVRREMEQIAAEAGVEPTRISFIMALHLLVDELHWLSNTSPGAIPRHLKKMRENVKRFILPRRRNRSAPREVKIKMSNYPKKRPRSPSPATRLKDPSLIGVSSEK
jgi:hypothetical protein